MAEREWMDGWMEDGWVEVTVIVIWRWLHKKTELKLDGWMMDGSSVLFPKSENVFIILYLASCSHVLAMQLLVLSHSRRSHLSLFFLFLILFQM